MNKTIEQFEIAKISARNIEQDNQKLYRTFS